METAISFIMNVSPSLELGVRVSAFAFSQIIFKLTIDICMRKIMLKMEYFINSVIYQMLEFFKRMISFYPEMILRPLSCFIIKTRVFDWKIYHS